MKSMIVALTLAAATAAYAMTPDERVAAYNAGNAAYRVGDFDAALSAWADIAIAHPALEANRGAAWYRKGDVGKATLHYLRAERLDPSDADVKASLAHIAARRDRASSPKAAGIVDAFALDTLALATLFLLLATAMAGGWRLSEIDARRGRVAARLVGIGLVLTLVVGGATVWRGIVFEGDRRVVALTEGVDARAEPNETSKRVFTLPAGTVAEQGRVEGNYARITLSSGATGWAPRERIARVAPTP
jgi:hypothetical protein